jgi:hypothetical protein
LLGLGITGLQAQESAITTGGNASGSGGSIVYSLGQIFYSTYDGTNGSINEGVQQPYEISVVIGIENVKEINISISAYPNPTNDYITLSITYDEKTNYDLSQFSYKLYDIGGKLLLSEEITDYQTSIFMGNLLPASYFVKIVQESKEIKTFQIIKTNIQ